MSPPCTSSERLERLLAGELAEAEANTLREHLTTCRHCQELLDRLTDYPGLEQFAGGPAVALARLAPLTLPEGLLQRLEQVQIPTTILGDPSSSPLSLPPPSEPLRPAGPVLGRLGSYSLLRKLGRGGMGVVYQAFDEELCRTVAVKVLQAGRDDRHARARFVREARAAAGIDHEHVVAVHAVATPADAAPYLVMQYVEGPTLRDRLNAEQRLAPCEAAEVCRQVALGLAAAHHTRLVHRDVKPSNILLDTAHGWAKLTDFGLARVLEDQAGLTREGVIAGTPEYMSPEHVRAPGQVDARSDVYSLGVTLYEALTGEVPFRGQPLMVLRRVVEDEPVVPSRLHHGVPRDLETICLKAMAKEPSRRYPSAAALADDLGRWLRGEPVRARPAGRVEKAWRWCRRNPAVASLTGAVAALLVLVAVGASLGFFHQRGLTADRQRALNDAKAQKDKVLETLDRQYSANAARALAGQEPYEALPWVLESLKLAEGDPAKEERHRIRFAGVLRAAPSTVHVWVHRGAVVGAEFSADGKRALTFSADGLAWVRDVKTGRGIALRHGEWLRHATFSPDGKWVVTSCDGSVTRVWNAETGKEVARLTGQRAAFSPDSKRIVTTSVADSTARVWDVETGREVFRLAKHQGGVIFAAFSPNNQFIVTGGYDGTACLWDAATGGLVRQLSHGNVVSYATFSPNGLWLVTCGFPAGWLWNLKTGARLKDLSRVHVTQVVHAAFSPDSRCLVTASDDHTARVWHLAAGISLVLQHAGRVRHVAFGGGRRFIMTACADGTARLWDAETGRPLGLTCKHGGGVNRAILSPDGGQVLTASEDGTARLWGLPQPRTTFASHGSLVLQGAFSRNGRLVVTAGWDGSARVWETDTGRERFRLTHNAEVRRVCFSKDERKIVTATTNGKVRVWNAETGKPITQELDHGAQRDLEVTISPDGRRVLSVGNKGLVRLWDATTGADVTPPFLRALRACAAFSPDGKRLLTGEASRAVVWDLATGKVVATRTHAHNSCVVAFSPDGRWALLVANQTVQVWDPQTGTAIGQEMRHDALIKHAAFDAAGQRVVTASYDGTARVWNARTGLPETPPLVHGGLVEYATFSPDGRHVLTAALAPDRAARLWDVASGELLAPPLWHRDGVWHVDFHPDGRRLLTCCGDGVARVWDLSPDERPLEELVRIAQVLVGRELREPGRHVALDVARYQVERGQLGRKYPHEFPLSAGVDGRGEK